jgi:chemotaxis protein methyltransferase CheR
MPDVRITEADFRAFRELFYRKTGIWFEDSKRYFVDRRLSERILASGNGSFLHYYQRLRYMEGGAEWQALINAMTVNETYFFREVHQFECLVNSMLEETVKRKGRNKPIRIWCIPCSSGEEPYSVALYLLERWERLDEFDVEILASDIDSEALERARDGIYSSRSVQNLPKEYLRKYFTALSGGEYLLCDEVRSAVSFSQVNLMDPLQTAPFSDIDIVFCRNLLIYFDDVSRRRAAETLYEALAPGGFICLGHSESMSRISSLFTLRRFPDAIVYQKPFGRAV